ncbi:hypothetical protein ABB37_03812 [Leptomonas pyrrhocoris]|uniref:Uncharacterized protein n=1 Tax=Leptomonas pyrrhocoris TaxID=157538 RepID=A0A0M9G3L5_LEPPY|nr:hypothetical protein ABB37_03812 [Leptomonas pyrrhocoris]XP_015659885.1 hypothetical protein ABB37_03812 [Leptomonas pyrrhocoris]KPA81445.1 hypothetical protein ABB37_03812 [Leptomonas pyrrhocoris]KPA81446.1 hypothetical protein ABB37_03812 [Leptomonas pyrrhocoris]|eukprot:XP_015659884.1 hypothetical protein ABB37_03812 [Leptomonas pyrrhocoris]
MACSAGRSRADEITHPVGLTRSVRHQAPSQRSVLPPAPTSSQLSAILREAAQLLPLSSMADLDSGKRRSGGVAGGLDVSSASLPTDYASFVRRQCPTSRRVQSSFAAAKAHSMLGELLHFFAVSLTCLFTEGVESAAVLSFPAEWEHRLNAPNAAALREKYLYELQGFSTLFTYVWGNVAAAGRAAPLPLREEEEDDDEREGKKRKSSASARTAAPQRSRSPSSAPSLASSCVAHELSEGRTAKVQRTAPVAAAAAAAAAPVGTNTRTHPLPQLVKQTTNGKTLHSALSSAPSAADAKPSRTSNTQTTQSSAVTSKSAPGHGSTGRRRSLPVFNADTTSSEPPALSRGSAVAATGRGHFLPSLPFDGLVPSRQLPGLEVRNARAGAQQGRGKALPEDASAPSSSPPQQSEASHFSASAKQLAIQLAKEQDRERELKRELGVRNVRNFAKEEDMHGYLQAFQQNMHSVLDGEEDTVEDGAGSGSR